MWKTNQIHVSLFIRVTILLFYLFVNKNRNLLKYLYSVKSDTCFNAELSTLALVNLSVIKLHRLFLGFYHSLDILCRFVIWVKKNLFNCKEMGLR